MLEPVPKLTQIGRLLGLRMPNSKRPAFHAQSRSCLPPLYLFEYTSTQIAALPFLLSTKFENKIVSTASRRSLQALHCVNASLGISSSDFEPPHFISQRFQNGKSAHQAVFFLYTKRLAMRSSYDGDSFRGCLGRQYWLLLTHETQ